MSEVEEYVVLCVVCLQKNKIANSRGICVACNTFFRRAVIGRKIFDSCSNMNKCYTFNPLRLNCKRCRYQKCYDCEIPVNFAYSADERNAGPTSNKLLKPLRDMLSSIEDVIHEMKNVEIAVVKSRSSTYNPLIFPSLDDIVQEPSKLYQASQCPPMPGWPLTHPEFMIKQKQLTELKVRVDEGMSFLQNQLCFINTKEWLPFDLMMAMENVKAQKFYKFLTKREDRRILLHGTCIVVATLTSAYNSYLSKKEVIHTPDGIGIGQEKRTAILESILGIEEKKIQNLKDSSNVMVPLIKDQIKLEEYMFLKMIAICDPGLIGLSDYASYLLTQQRNEYGRSLLNYCLFHHGSNYGPSRYLKLLDYLGVMERHRIKLQNFMTVGNVLQPSISMSDSRKKLQEEILISKVDEDEWLRNH